MNQLSTRRIALISALAAFSASVQLIHIGYRSPVWGMWLDIVAVSWIVAFFLFNLRAALFVSILGALIITLFSPDTWLGASMKFIATLPIILLLATNKPDVYQKPLRLIKPLFFGLIIRSLLTLPLNYYYALPIWTGMTPAVAIKTIPWYVIAGFNTIQGLIDVIFAWIIVFRFKISRYARH